MARHVLGRVAIALSSIATFAGVQVLGPPASATTTAKVVHRASPAPHDAKLSSAHPGAQRVTPKITTTDVAARAGATTAPTGLTPDGSPANTVSTTTFVVMPGMLTVPDPTQPGTVDRPAMTNDATANVDVELGGCVTQASATCTTWSSATWTFDGTKWTKRSPSSSPSG
ncbi:MAG: hypothetical protein ACRDYZ_04265, partial [Acidimicrobiales bacterium]